MRAKGTSSSRAKASAPSSSPAAVERRPWSTPWAGLDPLLQALGEPEGDPGRERLVDPLRRTAVLADEHELRITAGDADLDVGGVELRVELEGRLGEDVLDPPGEGRLDGDGEELCGAGRRLVSECGDAAEVLPERLDMTIDLHGCSMTPS